MTLTLLNQCFNCGCLFAKVALKLGCQITLDPCDVLCNLLQGMALTGDGAGTCGHILCNLLKRLTLLMDCLLALLDSLAKGCLVNLNDSGLGTALDCPVLELLLIADDTLDLGSQHWSACHEPVHRL